MSLNSASFLVFRIRDQHAFLSVRIGEKDDSSQDRQWSLGDMFWGVRADFHQEPAMGATFWTGRAHVYGKFFQGLSSDPYEINRRSSVRRESLAQSSASACDFAIARFGYDSSSAF